MNSKRALREALRRLQEAAHEYYDATSGGDQPPLLAGARLRIAAKAWAVADREARQSADVESCSVTPAPSSSRVTSTAGRAPRCVVADE